MTGIRTETPIGVVTVEFDDPGPFGLLDTVTCSIHGEVGEGDGDADQHVAENPDCWADHCGGKSCGGADCVCTHLPASASPFSGSPLAPEPPDGSVLRVAFGGTLYVAERNDRRNKSTTHHWDVTGDRNVAYTWELLCAEFDVDPSRRLFEVPEFNDEDAVQEVALATKTGDYRGFVPNLHVVRVLHALTSGRAS